MRFFAIFLFAATTLALSPRGVVDDAGHDVFNLEKRQCIDPPICYSNGDCCGSCCDKNTSKCCPRGCTLFNICA
ncbi:Ecp13 [Fulvia fulva]|uniref:Ecp13 n=1 Tax=Passalora fulva TaxID=5499 RepID=A0A1P8YXK7_PASFU|nr:Ecp13 [Fulvia fulva]AQA29236.1 extracellular protein 13 [Fulvia fulva]KAK4622217.1 Ecp13 [Fulvia fulva]KAK4622806.1 Ecp13 [Fulvia fulva]UJO19200.1 Ecp13 [Fulvia fulva]WPV15847.1 Ecp13 [Fulvia fulva]